jgi:putative Holliday junction resolvase
MPLLKNPFDLPQGRLLALDPGLARTGVAVSDETGTLATPLMVVPHKSIAEDLAALVALAAREKVVGVLVGLPLASGGEVGPQAQWARRYGGKLAARLAVPLAFWDESYSTVDATSLLHAGGRRARRGNRAGGNRAGGNRSAGDGIDAVAAAVILRDFLEARRARSHASEEP